MHSLSRPLRSFSSPLALGILLLFLGSLPLSTAASPSPSLQPGPYELLFKNGKTIRGSLVAIEGDRFRFKPYDAEAFTLPLSLIKESRPLDASASLRERAAALAKSGDLSQAIALLDQAPAGDAAIEKDLAAYVSESSKLRLQDRDADFNAYRKQYNAFLDKRLPAEALGAARNFLLEHPNDADALGDALSAEFLVHRSQARPAGSFTSLYIDALRKADPDSGALRAVEAEVAVSKNVQAKFIAERDAFLAVALDDALAYYKDFEIEAAIETLERALSLSPPADKASEMASLLAKARAEYDSEKADDRADGAKRSLANRERKVDSSPGGQKINNRRAEQIAKRIARRKSEPKRPR